MVRAVVLGDGLLRLGGEQWRCCHGRGGLGRHKQEGDSASPIGLLPLRRVLYRADRVAAPDTVAPIEPIGRADGWCDDPTHPCYNQAVTLPFPARHEALWRDDEVYDIVGVLGWNDAPAVPGAGSAIFLHVARADYAPTEGCIALLEADLRAVLAAGLSAVQIGADAARG